MTLPELIGWTALVGVVLFLILGGFWLDWTQREERKRKLEAKQRLTFQRLQATPRPRASGLDRDSRKVGR